MTMASRWSLQVLQESAALLCKPLVHKFLLSFKFRQEDNTDPEARKAGQQAENLKWQQEMLHRLLKMISLHSEGLVNESEVVSLRESILNGVTSLHDKGEWPEVTRDKLLFLQDLFFTNCISQEDYHEAKGLLIIRLITQGAELDLNDIILLPSAPDLLCNSFKMDKQTIKKHVIDPVHKTKCSKSLAPRTILRSNTRAKASLRTPRPIHAIITKDYPPRDPSSQVDSNKSSSPLFHTPIRNIASQSADYVHNKDPSLPKASISKCAVGVEITHEPPLFPMQSASKPPLASLASIEPFASRMKLLTEFTRKHQTDSVKLPSREGALEDGKVGYEQQAKVDSKDILMTEHFDLKPDAAVVKTAEFENGYAAKLAGHFVEEGDIGVKTIERGSEKERKVASSVQNLRTDCLDAESDALVTKSTEIEQSQNVKMVGQTVYEGDTEKISDIMAIKKKVQTNSAAANFFIDKVLGENVRKELKKICIEMKQADGSHIMTNEQIEDISLRLPADEIELRRLFSKVWCDSFGEMVLKVVARELENHVREMKDIRKASRKKRMKEIKQNRENDENVPSNSREGTILQKTPKEGKENSQNILATRCFTSMDVNTIQERHSPYKHTKSLKIDHHVDLEEKLQEEIQKMHSSSSMRL